MKRFFAIALLAALPAWAQHPEEAAFLAARDAFAAGDRAKLARAASGLVHHPLTPWADYFRLSLQLREDSDAGVAEFAGQHGGTWLGEKMRGEWLKWLIDRQDWARARAQFHAMQRPDAEAVCRGLEARLRLGETEAIGEARALLAAAAPLAGSCFAPLGRLAREGELPADAVWDRLRRLWAGNRVKDARVVATWLPAGEAPSIRAIDAASEQPARHLARLPAEFAATRRERELAALAVLRLARADLRVAAARWLLARHPGVDIIVSDDGLQHYRLARDVEIAVVDAATGLGNRWPLPAGPLREPPARLGEVDAVVQVLRGAVPVRQGPGPQTWHVEYRPGRVWRLHAPQTRCGLADLPPRDWVAATGIGRPQGFFDMLRAQGLAIEPRAFPDHHAFRPGELPAGGAVLMTEKDAVKCRAFAGADWWAVELDVAPEKGFIDWLDARLATISILTRGRRKGGVE